MPTQSRKSQGKQRQTEPERAHSSDSERSVGPKVEKVESKYQNQRVDPSQADAKLRQMIAQLKNLKAELVKSIEVLTQSATDWANASAKSLGEELDFDDDHIPKDDETIAAVDASIRDVLDTLQIIDLRSAVLSTMKDQVNNGQIITDILGEYERNWKPAVSQYLKRTSRQKYLGGQGQYLHFRTIVFEAIYDGRPVPNALKLILAEKGDEEEDDEIEIGAQAVDFKCPITMGILREPVSNNKCKHSFSGAAIREIMKSTRGPISCPVAGCPAKLSAADLHEDTQLATRVEQHERRLREAKETGGASYGKRTQTQAYANLDSSDEE